MKLVKLEHSEPKLFENMESNKFTKKIPVTTTVEQPETGDEIGKFQQTDNKPTLQDIERQLTSWQAVGVRKQMIIS
ncbi:MAG: hypothetical protein EZS28_009707 [Streblomastix strix]|uniref:Uncharacterized protein n=1 Tax=Streblomastix strix TaxID=222440 RepID=A0A5J4WIG6_9EUKA|nr:MAG: hypothetical protein EZS28_009707 [Streblomastix strix]